MASPVRNISNAIRNSLRSKKSSLASQTFYTQNHHWIRIEDHLTKNDNETKCTAKLGLTDHGQNKLGDLQKVYMDGSLENEMVQQGRELISVKHQRYDETSPKIYDIQTPIDCKLVRVNQELKDIPILVNRSPEHDGWICAISAEIADIKKLMNKEEYNKFLKRSKR